MHKGCRFCKGFYLHIPCCLVLNLLRVDILLNQCVEMELFVFSSTCVPVPPTYFDLIVKSLYAQGYECKVKVKVWVHWPMILIFNDRFRSRRQGHRDQNFSGPSLWFMSTSMPFGPSLSHRLSLKILDVLEITQPISFFDN